MFLARSAGGFDGAGLSISLVRVPGEGVIWINAAPASAEAGKGSNTTAHASSTSASSLSPAGQAAVIVVAIAAVAAAVTWWGWRRGWVNQLRLGGVFRVFRANNLQSEAQEGSSSRSLVPGARRGESVAFGNAIVVEEAAGWHGTRVDIELMYAGARGAGRGELQVEAGVVSDEHLCFVCLEAPTEAIVIHNDDLKTTHEVRVFEVEVCDEYAHAG